MKLHIILIMRLSLLNNRYLTYLLNIWLSKYRIEICELRVHVFNRPPNHKIKLKINQIHPCINIIVFMFNQVSVPVLRRFGLNGQVDIGYTTHPGTALPYQDYFPETGTLTFQHGQREQVIKVRPRQDDEPEGLETFYLNLTMANLVVPQYVFL